MRIKILLLILIVLSFLKVQAQIAEGLWTTGCQNGLIKEQIYQNDNVSNREHFYQDKDCQRESFIFETIGSVQYTSTNTEFIDFTYETLTLEVFNTSLVADLNSRKVCGFDNWQTGQAKTITGLHCALFDVNNESAIPQKGDQKFGIYSVLEDKLYYGQLTLTNDGSTPQKRPQKLNTTFIYTRP
jgi:hypothetical protein